MRKLLALVILLIVPLQLAFAAAGEYCEIGKGDTGKHFGHHVHLSQHNADSSTKKPDGHSGCGYCDLGCAQAQVSTFAFVVPDLPFAADKRIEPAAPLSHTPPGIDRPPRFALA